VEEIVDKLLASEEPSIRLRVRVGVCGDDEDSASIRRLRNEIRDSSRVRALLSERGPDGGIPGSPYRKWTGSHWVLTLLGEIGHPPGDRTLRPMVDRASAWAMGHTPRIIKGLPRRCASQQGNALLYLIRLGFGDERCDELADRLMGWQWPDGGWNCDKKPEACHASFHESLIPMRALFAYARATRRRKARSAARRAAEMFLDRRLFRRKTTGEVIRPRFAVTHYPYFWQYTFLHGLVAMTEAGLIRDPRCSEALDLLESKRLPDGGFPAERKYYSVPTTRGKRNRSGQSRVGWGPTSTSRRGKSNEFATAEALTVLKAAGRI
jgi:hypothetical protein